MDTFDASAQAKKGRKRIRDASLCEISIYPSIYLCGRANAWNEDDESQKASRVLDLRGND